MRCAELLAAAPCPVTPVSREVLAAMAETVTPQGVLGVAPLLDVPLASALQGRPRLVAVLEAVNDPGNAERAITVGSTHRDAPHAYGVSFFSSKGPTGDGRCKPDLVAPGERITSCAAGEKLRAVIGDADPGATAVYVEDSGTSMAAPHVSGIIAAFLSARREFIGEPDRVKALLLGSCTDLQRDRPQQGAGLPNLTKMLLNT